MLRWWERTSNVCSQGGALRGGENGNCNFFCPRRAAKGREELQRQLQERQLQHLLSTEDTEGHGERQLQLQNGNGYTFCPRRTAKGREELQRQLQERQLQHLLSTEDAEGHGERQLQLLLSTKGREGPRRTATATSGTATATPFVHGAHGGPRRTATATSFVHEGPRRTTKGREELQRQLQERQLQHLLSTEDAEGHLERQLQLQSGNGNAFCPRRTAKGHEGPRRTATATSGTATATPFVHEGPLRATKGREELQGQHLLSTKGREEHLFSTEGHGVRLSLSAKKS